MERARKEHADLFNAYQSEGSVSSRPIFKAASRPDAVRAFENTVNAIAGIRKVGRTQAMEIARREHPAQFLAYQAA